MPRAGQAQPIQPPSQGTPYGQPADPYAVNDLKSLPFYKSLRVGETVRKRETGQYDVYDASGRPIETYSPGRADPSIITKGAVRDPLFQYQNEGMTSQQLSEHQAKVTKDAERERQQQRQQQDEWMKSEMARIKDRQNTTDMIYVRGKDKFGRLAGYSWQPKNGQPIPPGSKLNYITNTKEAYASAQNIREHEYLKTPAGKEYYRKLPPGMKNTRPTQRS
jgi:hypothetical protein